jgi:hypothetical protein
VSRRQCVWAGRGRDYRSQQEVAQARVKVVALVPSTYTTMIVLLLLCLVPLTYDLPVIL